MSRLSTSRWAVLRWLVLGSVVAAAGVVACSGPKSSQTLGTNSNWFVECADDAECTGAARCECARCTRGCESDRDCSGIAHARCAPAATPAALSQCGPEASASGVCLEACAAGSCAESEACVSGTCVSRALPDGDFCAPVATAGQSEHTSEDALFALIQNLRAAGGVTCGAGAAATPASLPVRANGALWCAARVLAADIEGQGTRGLVDSSGRGTRERLQAAGYASRLWAEGFAIGSGSANDALGVMLADESACAGLTRDGYTDVGVARVGDTYVVTLGAE
jgi:hypothetical protein